MPPRGQNESETGLRAMLEARERQQEGMLRKRNKWATLLLLLGIAVVLSLVGALAWRNRESIQQLMQESEKKPAAPAPALEPGQLSPEDLKLARDVYQFMAPDSGKQAAPASQKQEGKDEAPSN